MTSNFRWSGRGGEQRISSCRNGGRWNRPENLLEGQPERQQPPISAWQGVEFDADRKPRSGHARWLGDRLVANVSQRRAKVQEHEPQQSDRL